MSALPKLATADGVDGRNSLIYLHGPLDALSGRFSFGDGLFSVMLLTSGYQPDRRWHARRSDVDLYEARGDGYRSGGMRVDVSIEADDLDDDIVITLGKAVWPAPTTVEARYAVYFHDSGRGAFDDELVALIDLGQDVRSVIGEFSLTPSTVRFGV